MTSSDQAGGEGRRRQPVRPSWLPTLRQIGVAFIWVVAATVVLSIPFRIWGLAHPARLRSQSPVAKAERYAESIARPGEHIVAALARYRSTHNTYPAKLSDLDAEGRRLASERPVGAIGDWTYARDPNGLEWQLTIDLPPGLWPTAQGHRTVLCRRSEMRYRSFGFGGSWVGAVQMGTWAVYAG